MTWASSLIILWRARDRSGTGGGGSTSRELLCKASGSGRREKNTLTLLFSWVENRSAVGRHKYGRVRWVDHPVVQRPFCGALQAARSFDPKSREALCLDIVRSQNVNHRQYDPRAQTPLNNLPNLPVQAPGPGPSHTVHIVHHCGAVCLNQDVCATQPPLESLQESSLQLEKVYMERRMIGRPDPLPLQSKDCNPQPHP